MKAKDLEKLILEHTKDGVVDFEAVSKEVNEFTNAVVVKNTEKVKSNTVSEFLKGLSLENVTDEGTFKSYVESLKLSESEKDKLITDFTKKLDDEAKAKTEIESKYSEASSKLTNIERRDLMRSKGINANYLDDVLTIASTRLSEEKPFDVVIDELLGEEKYSIFRETKQTIKPNFIKPLEKNHYTDEEKSILELRKL